MEGLLTFAESAQILHSAGSVRQVYSFATCPFILRTFCHPTPLKNFKRDGVYIFESKRKAAVAQAPPFPQDPSGFYV